MFVFTLLEARLQVEQLKNTNMSLCADHYVTKKNQMYSAVTSLFITILAVKNCCLWCHSLQDAV